MSSISRQAKQAEFLSELLKSFEAIKDPRTGNNRRHFIGEIIIIAICAILCGARGWLGVEAVAKSKKKWFQKFLILPNGIPSHDTFARVFAILDPKELQVCLQQWSAELHKLVSGKTVAIDGKTLRRSFDTASGTKAMHQVTAWACEAGIALGVTKVAAKSNEISAIPDVLDSLNIVGCTVTIDAIGCQKSIAAKIRDKGADYVLTVKKNQLHFYLNVKVLLDHIKSTETAHYQTNEKGHGRIEQRRYWMSNFMDGIKDAADWKDLRTVGCVESTRIVNGKETVETRYFISSCPQNIKAFAHSVRKHWAIENELHWVLDVEFGSDLNRMRMGNSAINFSILQMLCLSMLKREKTSKDAIATKMIICASNEKYLEKVIKRF